MTISQDKPVSWRGWIDSTAELPDDEMTVLIALSDGEVWTGFHDAGQWRFVCGELVDQGGGTTVTHWAEFPEPPPATDVNKVSTTLISLGRLQPHKLRQPEGYE